VWGLEITSGGKAAGRSKHSPHDSMRRLRGTLRRIYSGLGFCVKGLMLRFKGLGLRGLGFRV